jgi:signal transduction histidine kinase
VAAALQDETGKLEALLALYRLLPLDRETPPEPLHLPDLVPSAVELHGHHVAFRELPCAVDGDADAPPVLAPHSALLHALLVLLAAAARAGRGESGRLRWAAYAAGGGERVVIIVDGAGEGAATAAWLLGDAAAVGVDDGAATVALPTLAAARRGG